jgi:hypothetical protein
MTSCNNFRVIDGYLKAITSFLKMVSVKISKISDFIKGTATMKELILTFSPQKGSQKLRKQAVLTQKVRIGFIGSLKNYSSPLYSISWLF